jgi:hypothetical protein
MFPEPNETNRSYQFSSLELHIVFGCVEHSHQLMDTTSIS